jgi:hypothetical protein
MLLIRHMLGILNLIKFVGLLPVEYRVEQLKLGHTYCALDKYYEDHLLIVIGSG